MLQQTQVKTVLPYYERWLSEWPDFASLAAAPEERVLRLWEGLGYYSRARNLHRLARRVAALPRPPDTREGWLALPGVGPYTAAAIMSIAQDLRAACVDGNVVRILARLTADATVFPDSASAAKIFAPLADGLLPEISPGEHNQAMMELGATLCVRANPLCPQCPVRIYCAGTRTGTPAEFPRFAPRKIEQVAVARAWCERDAALLLHRADAGARRLAGQYELPTLALLGFEANAATPERLRAARRRAITRFRITESIYTMPAPLATAPLPAGVCWVPFAELDGVTLSGPHRRWINELRPTVDAGRVSKKALQ